MKKIGSLMFLFFISFCSVVQAASIRIEAAADKPQLGLGESVTVVVRVIGDDDFEIEGQPKVNTPQGLELINAFAGGRQSSSNMSIVNGQTQFNKNVVQTYNYQFSPQKEGVLLIPSIEVKVNGQTFQSNPVKIEVDEKFRGRRNANPIPGRPQFPSGFDDEDIPGFGQGFGGQGEEEEDVFSQLLRQRQRLFDQLNRSGGLPNTVPPGQLPSRQLDINTNESFFVWIDVDKKEVYEGEQITANWYIYTKGNLESLDRVKFPDLKGFWKEIIEEVPSLQFTRELVNGVVYQKALLASHALFPIKAGTAVIDEFRVKGRTRSLTQNGWGQPTDSTKVSKRLSIKVLPLPLEGRTPQFSGAVGSYRVTLNTEEANYPAHQPFSIKVRFEGLGNAKLIDLPNISWPEGLEVYDTKSDSKFFKDGQSFKEFEILVIPRKEGPLEIPTMTFTYYDSAQKKYVSQNTEPLKLNITAGSAQAQGSANVSNGNSPAQASQSYIPLPILEWPQSSFQWSILALPVYLFMALMVFLGTLASFLRQFKMIKQEMTFSEMIESRVKKLEAQKDFKLISVNAVNLIYLLGAQLAGVKKADQEWSALTQEIPLQFQKKYLEKLNQLFDYFQLLGFSPEDIRNKLVQQKPLQNQVMLLKKLSLEIAEESKAE